MKINSQYLKKFIISTLSLFFLLPSINMAEIHHQKTASPPSLDQQLPPCPDKPNCINSEYPDDKAHYLAPLNYPEANKAQVMTLAETIIKKMGGEIVFADQHYLKALFSSRIFGFIDDFELRLESASKQVHIRSASRTGYSDFGVNKRRVKEFSQQFKQQITP
ncbi:DUF1499 domain-containing protein [sulfur-oxidizing endosymbiont of Gigantopelta aegis]|uniref:DUF1499 domain-containing protein n=1 Tax=sulfur-oxidizing endosymbiont of Gigantopelta aegis TaxID=2794934 RepID=UPI0018DE6478|nr:DUF1499 domain-containing protein [sulfur-oxidizing endosymbiont of Gigantopelta aegis]